MDSSESLYVEVDVSQPPQERNSVTGLQKSAKAQKQRGFDPGKALRGISRPTDKEISASACKTRGDGRYSNGSHLVQSGNKVHIGPEAFSEGNIQETMQELANYGAFGNDNKPRTKTLPSDNENAGQRIVKDVSADGRASTSVSAADREMIMDLETILSLSEKVSQSCRGEEAASGLYDISSHNEDDVHLESKPTEKKKVVPEYQMKTFPDSTGKIEVRISMPKVTAVSEVSLSVIGKVLCVSSETYDLKVPLETFNSGDNLCTKAKWLKEKKTLKVTLKVE